MACVQKLVLNTQKFKLFLNYTRVKIKIKIKIKKGKGRGKGRGKGTLLKVEWR